MVSKNFKGQVKISDVQETFNEIVNRTNEMLEFYNSSEGVQDIDYTKGSPTLAPSGYTLTVGGLKQAMKFEDLEIWKRSARLSAELYKSLINSITKQLNTEG